MTNEKKSNPTKWSQDAIGYLFQALVDKFGPYDPETHPTIAKSDEYKDFCAAFGKTLKNPATRNAVIIMINYGRGYPGPGEERYGPLCMSSAHWSGWKKLEPEHKSARSIPHELPQQNAW